MEINSNNKTILVFSDPHQNIDYVEHILNRENYDQVVCLGDWFDSFSRNSPWDVEATCNFLKKLTFKDNFITLFGNHDIHYLFDNTTTICTGYTEDKNTLIMDCLGNFLPAIRDKFKWYIWIDDWFCSHAGINTYHFPPLINPIKSEISKWLDEQIIQAELHLCNGGRHWLYGCGGARGGRYKVGGIVWQDFKHEFEPIDGLKQIVGHTSGDRVIGHHADGNLDLTTCDNLNIDCHLGQYLLIKNGKLIIKDLKDL
jgi:hypothetical protein